MNKLDRKLCSVIKRYMLKAAIAYDRDIGFIRQMSVVSIANTYHGDSTSFAP
jgi:adenosylmethionine-8-amino-7-oxononanoate aminotransferase